MAIKNEHSLGRRMRKGAVSYAMLAPFMIFFILFTVLPVLAAIGLSFTTVFITAIKNTLIFAVICGPVSYLFAFFMAWLINEMPKQLRVLLTVIFYAPSVSGNVYFIWTYLFSGDSYGLVNGWLMQLGLIQQPVLWLTNPTYNLTIIIIVQLWLSLGVSFLSFIAGLQGIDPSQYEAGAIDGIRNRFQELWYITIPNMKSMMLFGAVMQIATIFGVGDITQNLGGGYNSVNYSTLTILNHITDYGTVRYEMGYACCIAVFLFVLIVLFKKLVFRLLKW